MDQLRLDRAAGLRTGALISGYEGSPLGGYDLALGRVAPLLKELGIHFVPGVNEDLAATAILGSMMHEQVGPSRVDGVLGIWYGKGPGVDRSGDALRHANLVGCPGNHAALVLAGDDPTSKSSTIPHQSDLSLFNVGIPILAPGNTQEVLDYGLLGVSMSRYSGAWVGLKLVTNVCDGGGTVDVDLARLTITQPGGYVKKNDHRLVPPFANAMEVETHWRRLEAARAFARANGLNRITGSREARIGIATAGKTYYDLAQALGDLGASDRLEELGLRIAKFGMTFPLERQFVEEFAQGLDLLIVIEEKRSLLEMQIRDTLFNTPLRPLVLGKEDRDGKTLFPPYAELDPDMIGVALARLVPGLGSGERLVTMGQALAAPRQRVARPPNFCSGCPHNRSTLLLEGQVAGGGTGCHGMAMLLEGAGRGFIFGTHMGGEGAPWIGMAPFCERGHIFQNLGDGTFFHSGSLAVQACVAAGVNITFKILYNGHVAMTGGQDAQGALPVPELTRKLDAEGVRKIVVLVEDVARYNDRSRFAPGAQVRDRLEIETVLAELAATPGVTAMIYDQECAAEKRRKRSRGRMEEPVERLVINQEVCEGCGHCVAESNCASLVPVASLLGPKMSIHQSSCNKDYTCALGDCPSFVSVRIAPGTGLRKRPVPVLPAADVPEPGQRAEIGPRGYRIIAPGVGGTGVVTVNALLATAAQRDGLHVATLDQTGLAQKGGAVVSHLLLSQTPVEAAARTNVGNANLILGFDLLGAAHSETLKCADAGRTAAVVNSHIQPTSDLIRKGIYLAGPEAQLRQLALAVREDRSLYCDATRLAEGLFGSHMLANVFLLGVAWQAGLIPLSRTAIEEAVRLNGVDVERNLQAFLWGRKYVADPSYVERLVSPEEQRQEQLDPVAMLTAYQDAAYASAWSEFVAGLPVRLRETAGRNLLRLMMYKDEYEVARLLTAPRFEDSVHAQFQSVEAISYNLHPPLLRRWGLKRKLRLGAWMRGPLRLLAALRRLRGGPLDLFGYAAHRRMERGLIGWYKALARDVAALDVPAEEAVAILDMASGIKGYEGIKEAAAKRVRAEVAARLESARQAVPSR